MRSVARSFHKSVRGIANWQTVGLLGLSCCLLMAGGAPTTGFAAVGGSKNYGVCNVLLAPLV